MTGDQGRIVPVGFVYAKSYFSCLRYECARKSHDCACKKNFVPALHKSIVKAYRCNSQDKHVSAWRGIAMGQISISMYDRYIKAGASAMIKLSSVALARIQQATEAPSDTIIFFAAWSTR